MIGPKCERAAPSRFKLRLHPSCVASQCVLPSVLSLALIWWLQSTRCTHGQRVRVEHFPSFGCVPDGTPKKIQPCRIKEWGVVTPVSDVEMQAEHNVTGCLKAMGEAAAPAAVVEIKNNASVGSRP